MIQIIIFLKHPINDSNSPLFFYIKKHTFNYSKNQGHSFVFIKKKYLVKNI